MEFLVDRAGVAAERERWLRHRPFPDYDVAGADDETWALLSWIAGSLLHGRTLLARIALGDLIGRRIAPVTGLPLYAIDGQLRSHFEPVFPASFDAPAVARSLRAAAALYDELLDEWSVRSGAPRPQSAFRPAVHGVLDRLISGGGTRLAPA